MSNKNFFKIVLAVFFLLQPMVVYLSSFEPGDCDDKAVHYYTASYWSAKSEKKKQLDDLIKNLAIKYRNDPRWQRTEIRINVVPNYPLANTFIAFLGEQGQTFPLNVNNGLLVVTLLALLSFVLITSLTEFGFWQALLLVNLVSFYSLRVRFLVPEVPRNMLPFISYVPRGGLALLAVLPLLTYSANKKKLCLISLILMLLWHLGMALMFICFIIFAFLISEFLIKKSQKRKENYYCGLFISSSILLFLLRVTSIFISFLSKRNISHFWFIRSPFLMEIPSRLSGISYVILVLLIICGLRILLQEGKGKIFEFKLKGKFFQINAQVLIWFILIFLTLNHLSSYSWVFKKKTGFFLEQCQGYEKIRLPEEVEKLDLSDEPRFFLSLAEFLQ